MSRRRGKLSISFSLSMNHRIEKAKLYFLAMKVSYCTNKSSLNAALARFNYQLLAHYHIAAMRLSFYEYTHRETQKHIRIFKNTVAHSGSYTFTISFFRDFSANSSYSIFFSLTKKSGTELHKTNQLKQSSKLMKCVVNIVNPLTWFADSYLIEHFPRTYVMKMPPYLTSVNLNRQCYSN